MEHRTLFKIELAHWQCVRVYNSNCRPTLYGRGDRMNSAEMLLPTHSLRACLQHLYSPKICSCDSKSQINPFSMETCWFLANRSSSNTVCNNFLSVFRTDNQIKDSPPTLWRHIRKEIPPFYGMGRRCPTFVEENITTVKFKASLKISHSFTNWDISQNQLSLTLCILIILEMIISNNEVIYTKVKNRTNIDWLQANVTRIDGFDWFILWPSILLSLTVEM